MKSVLMPEYFSCRCRNSDQVVSWRVYKRSVGRDSPQKLLSAEVWNSLFCASENFPYLLKVAICAGEQSEVDKAVFSLHGNSCFHQAPMRISLGSGEVREPKKRSGGF
jgi:hypothetical protein